MTLVEGLLKNLRGEVPSYMRREFLSKEAARQKLMKLTGQDFGVDAAGWESWIRTQQASGKQFPPRE
jgi:hypothetical protein